MNYRPSLKDWLYIAAAVVGFLCIMAGVQLLFAPELGDRLYHIPLLLGIGVVYFVSGFGAYWLSPRRWKET